MTLQHLFLGITFCTALSSYEPLLAHSPDENSNDFVILTDSICDFLMRGHCPDEVKEMLDDDQKHPYDIEKLALQIQELLNKQCSKDNIINIITNSKESEEFYGRINFWTRITTRYFVLKALISLVITLILLYLLYRWFKFEIPWRNNKFNNKNQFCNNKDQEAGRGQFCGCQESGVNKSQHNGNDYKCEDFRTNQKEQSLDPVTHTRQQANTQEQKKLISTTQSPAPATPQPPTQTNPQPLTPVTPQIVAMATEPEKLRPTNDTQCDKSCCEIVEISKIDKLDLNLKNLVAKQVIQARQMGLDLSAIQLEPTVINIEPGDESQLYEKMLQQLDYAKSIGLIPATEPK